MTLRCRCLRLLSRWTRSCPNWACGTLRTVALEAPRCAAFLEASADVSRSPGSCFSTQVRISRTRRAGAGRLPRPYLSSRRGGMRTPGPTLSRGVLTYPPARPFPIFLIRRSSLPGRTDERAGRVHGVPHLRVAAAPRPRRAHRHYHDPRTADRHLQPVRPDHAPDPRYTGVEKGISRLCGRVCGVGFLEALSINPAPFCVLNLSPPFPYPHLRPPFALTLSSS